MNRRAERGGPQSDKGRPRDARPTAVVHRCRSTAYDAQFRRSIFTYVKALTRLRRAAERSMGRPGSTQSIALLLRARLREVEAASTYHEAARKVFRAAV
jgi:hypothetical protein